MVCPFRVVVFVVSVVVALLAAAYTFWRASRVDDLLDEDLGEGDGGYGSEGEDGAGAEKSGGGKSWARIAAEFYTGKFLYDLYQSFKAGRDACPVVGGPGGANGGARRAKAH